ncbi:MAG: hypothetical protein LBJ00_13910 [Planctomycetaceae bacterium]|nr:hypothetical protein [Planctomycetaceae bacterium]
MKRLFWGEAYRPTGYGIITKTQSSCSWITTPVTAHRPHFPLCSSRPCSPKTRTAGFDLWGDFTGWWGWHIISGRYCIIVKV